MLPSIVSETLPLLVRALQVLGQREHHREEAEILAHELSVITAMIAGKFTNDRTAEGISKAFCLTVGGVSLGLALALKQESDEDALDYLIQHGAEQAFQAGFRLVRELANLPEDAFVGGVERDPIYQQRRLKDLFVDICNANPNSVWTGPQKYLTNLKQRQESHRMVECAKWLRRNNIGGSITDDDLNADGVIALAVIFAIEGGGKIVARVGQRKFENFVANVRASECDFEAGWVEFLGKIPPQHQAVIRERIDTFRNHCSVIKKIRTKASIKMLFKELENYAGSEIEVEYS